MMNHWRTDKGWADTFKPEVVRVIQLVQPKVSVVEIAPSQLDEQEAVDLIVREQRWAWRHRRPDCRFRDFTIRYDRPRGTPTEWTKIADGYGDFYVYSWTTTDSERRRRFSEWCIVDLNVFRSIQTVLDGQIHPVPNNPPDSRFKPIPLTVLRDHGAIVAEKMVQPALF